MMKSTSARNRPSVWNSPPPMVIQRPHTPVSSAKKQNKSSLSSPSLTAYSFSTHTAASTATSSVASTPRKTYSSAKKKPDWNGYLTDGDRFRSSPDELRKRRAQLVSRHNVLVQLEDKLGDSPQCEGEREGGAEDERLSSLDLLAAHEDEDTLHAVEERKNTLDISRQGVENTQKTAQNKKKKVSKKTKKSAKDVKKVLFHSSSEDESEREREREREREDEVQLDSADEEHEEREGHENENAFFGERERERERDIRSTRSPSAWRERETEKQSKSPSLSLHRHSASPVKHKNAMEKTTKNALKHDASMSERDAREIAREIRALREELRYYEEIAGERAILESDALDEIFDENDELRDEDAVDTKKILRFLVQLVCQSMSHLLKKEVEHQHLQSQIDLLSARVNEISLSSSRGHPFAASKTSAAMPSSSLFARSSSSYADPYASYRPAQREREGQEDEGEGEEEQQEEEHDCQDDVLSPPPPPPLPQSSQRAAVSKMEQLIAQSKRVGDATTRSAFQAVQLLDSSQRVSLSAAGESPVGGAVSRTSAAGPAVQALHELSAAQHATAKAKATATGFTGASPTDLLFMHFNQATASLSSSQAEQATPETDPDLALSPQAAAELAARTYDLYSNNAQLSQRGRSEEDVVASSYDSMIDRLSSHLSHGVNKSPVRSHALLGKNAQTNKSFQDEEAVSMVDPKPRAPMPLQAPQHPRHFLHTKTSSEVLDTRKQLFPEKKIFDATSGFF